MLLHLHSNESYPVSFLLLQPYDVRAMSHWDEAFDWSVYFGKPRIEAYKMVVTGNDEIQGAIALERRHDHVYIHLIESAPHNRRIDKVFDYIGEHLIAFGCKRSMDLGQDGFVAFQAKTKLISYYERNMQAQHIRNGYMIISDTVAKRLIMLYLT